MRPRFSLFWFAITLLLFLTEVIIAVWLKSCYFIRAYLGDVLVVILIYTFVLTFFKIKEKAQLIVGIFLFSVLVEVLQYFSIAEKLGFREGSVGHIVIGNSFSWLDILCYAVGCAFIFVFVKMRSK
ncbi:ribosomal maturation YjgA family protein [Riemerella anatipestifer]|uniref:ribosomal maturation YjgA family protein n=1 Tax=Riemerella anatipestifer TaxID=34085 RepID=UPI001374FB51|nr:DUF2809 domain-containing protein [Riemerella anatipestifer]MDY3520166.1 DUF2809 domain-containing protein [Riemerella anatipestifer]MDY3532850.1 DUF2809 domain-containing protein [Riemerella anatipestifer]MDY3534595.1 DUF2809 domain-containing protein [Riemerella anatipestifer]